MSINDSCIPVYNAKHGYWILKKGRETFFNDKNEMRTWDTEQEAIQWALDHGELIKRNVKGLQINFHEIQERTRHG